MLHNNYIIKYLISESIFLLCIFTTLLTCVNTVSAADINPLNKILPRILTIYKSGTESYSYQNYQHYFKIGHCQGFLGALLERGGGVKALIKTLINPHPIELKNKFPPT